MGTWRAEAQAESSALGYDFKSSAGQCVACHSGEGVGALWECGSCGYRQGKDLHQTRP